MMATSNPAQNVPCAGPACRVDNSYDTQHMDAVTVETCCRLIVVQKARGGLIVIEEARCRLVIVQRTVEAGSQAKS